MPSGIYTVGCGDPDMVRPFWLILTLPILCPAAWPQTVSVVPSSITGVEILGPESPQYGPYLDQIIGPARSPLLSAWLPYGVVLRNCTAQPLMAVAVHWEVTGADGPAGKFTIEATAWDRPDHRLAAGKNAVAIPVLLFQEGSRLPPQYQLNPPAGAPLGSTGSLPRFQSAQTIKVNLDGVVFPSGQFVGPDLSHEFERDVAFTTVPPQVAAKVLEMRTAGVSIADITAWLSTASTKVRTGGHSADATAQTAKELLQRYKSKGETALFELAQNESQPLIHIHR